MIIFQVTNEYLSLCGILVRYDTRTRTHTHIDERGVSRYKLAGPVGPEEDQGPECFDFSPARLCRGRGPK
jgi:hypothetical protein